MILASTSSGGGSLKLIEGGFSAIVVAMAFWRPQFGASAFTKIELLCGELARKKPAAVIAVGLLALLSRLAILPICPIPLPFVPDDFSFLLSAQTFLAGRLTNPSPALWTHFETIHVTASPAYVSMYFPGPGLVMALGALLFGHPWFGTLIAGALMCGAITWMLQGWLPASWALLGGVLAVFRITLFSYWMNTYTGGGLVAAFGGALVLGAMPRFIKHVRVRHGLILSIGMVLLAWTRPYEGLLLCLPVVIAITASLIKRRAVPARLLFLRLAAPLALLAAGIGWMGYYDYRAFGSPLTLPYTVDRAQYAMAPYYVWQNVRPDPGYRHESLRKFYYERELNTFQRIHSLRGFIPATLVKVLTTFLFFAGFLLLIPLVMIANVLRDRRTRFLVLSSLVLAGGMAIENFLIPHYLAPFTAAFYAIGLQAMRHMRVWKPGSQPVGLAIVRMTVATCLLLAGVRLLASPLHIRLAAWPPSEWSATWSGPGYFGLERSRVVKQLEDLPGKQLAIVRYTPDHNQFDEWVYNAPDMNQSKIIWARDMGTDKNDELLKYYSGRKVWLVEPDLTSAPLSMYPVSAELKEDSSTLLTKVRHERGYK
jgi:hypothetical protein